ncbi:MAG: GNAT family N-acetyltransferase [Nocardiopsaceae bacterium]|nr:GNAT family N-acetyltransferase [Nocardiopsaceae bacterium]
MEIRPARDDDAAQLGVVHVLSWQAAYRGLLPQDFLDGLDPARRARYWERALGEAADQRYGLLVADAGDRLAGFAHFCPSRDEDADPARTGELSSIYLLPESWGRGVGRQLMAAALAGLARAGYGQATLWVLDSNDRARRFYRVAGWAVDGAVKEEEGPGFTLTEVRYRRPLP